MWEVKALTGTDWSPEGWAIITYLQWLSGMTESLGILSE